MSTYFCQDVLKRKEIVRLFNQSILCKHHDLEFVYNKFINRYNEQINNDKRSNYSGFKIDKNDVNLFLEKKLDASYVGVDIPIWFDNNEPRYNKRIFIISQDPLRNDEQFNAAAADCHLDAVIGTPYALHEPKWIKENIYNFCFGLINTYSMTYFTDIFKIYFMYNNTKSSKIYNRRRSMAFCEFQKILFREIELLKPDFIITLGRIPTLALVRNRYFNMSGQVVPIQENEMNIIPIIHISQNVWPLPMQSFLSNNGFSLKKNPIEARLEIIEKIITESLE